MDPRTPSVPPNRQGDVGAAETRRQGPRVPKGKSFNPRMCQETRGVKIEDKTWKLETPLTRPRSRAPTAAPAVPEGHHASAVRGSRDQHRTQEKRRLHQGPGALCWLLSRVRMELSGTPPSAEV